jgi:predicted nucleic acid-binding protein
VTVVPRLFLDASVFIAAAGPHTGASALVLALCRHGRARAVSSRLILREAERNIQSKLGANALLRFYQEIATLDLDLAAALKGTVEVLLTLDRKHFLTARVLQAGLPFAILTPGDFLRRLVS